MFTLFLLAVATGMFLMLVEQEKQIKELKEDLRYYEDKYERRERNV